ncbi:MAG: hypothetical protein EXS08_03245 [Planctomycetes bacterium]|nr:hypothetical protein [Planctomycetota bacterium]
MSSRSLRILLVLAAATALADLGLSTFFIRDGLLFDRPLPPFGAITHPKQVETLDKMVAEPVGTWTFDAELGWTWRPSSASEDGLYTTNALAARGPREYARAPASGTRRVLTFGDSFTFCDEVPAEATFQVQLERLEPALEVLNFGVSGYGTDQALLRFRRVAPGLGAEVVCLGLMLENIGRNVNRYRPLWATRTGVCVTKPRFVLDAQGRLELVPQPFATREELHAAILDGSVLERVAEHEYWLGRPTLPTGKLSALLRLGAGYFAYRARTPALLWQEPEEEPFRVTLALVQQFRREALALGARLAPVLIFPAKDDLREYALRGKPYWSALYAELERQEIPYLDLVSALAGKSSEMGEDPPAKSLYSGGHLSYSGNAVVAHELLQWMRAQD